MRQWKKKVVPGTTFVSRTNPRPGWTSSSRILWCWPACVFMTAVLPVAKGPSRSIVVTFGFHSPQVLVSDQIRQTWSGLALVSTEVPYSAIRFASSHHLTFGNAGKSTEIIEPDAARIDAEAERAGESCLPGSVARRRRRRRHRDQADVRQFGRLGERQHVRGALR